jgi:hypothetical protein
MTIIKRERMEYKLSHTLYRSISAGTTTNTFKTSKCFNAFQSYINNIINYIYIGKKLSFSLKDLNFFTLITKIK